MITDEQIKDAYLRQYEKGILKKEVRSYEVSIWTLQDEFITVLKWSDVEHKGRIEYPKMTIADDGTEELTFSIPMYYNNGTTILIENPLWSNTQNGNIMINFRKVKVIFNKQTEDEEIFEFIITKINEKHEGDVLTCEVTCEGLAFHELGKIGYKYVLSLDEFDYDYKAWQENPVGTAPKSNVQYWCDKIGLKPWPTNDEVTEPGQWYYEIQMNWASFPYSTRRLNNIVYEEAFATDWDDELLPVETEDYREKLRIVDISESNLYNITQEIAKQFNIYCKYKYIYDTNYHIINRKVIFYNNFIQDYNTLCFTYPHSSTSVSRELDSTDVVTKMYIQPMDDASTLLGTANIKYCRANMTQEDYILNFDYFIQSKNITSEQKDGIEKYEKSMHVLNNELTPRQYKLAALENQKNDVQAKITHYTESIKLDAEQITANGALKAELVASYSDQESGDGYLDVYNNLHPALATIIEGTDGLYYINLATQKKGIQINTLKIYRSYNTANHTLSNELQFSITYDEYGNPSKIYGIAPTVISSQVYLTYKYDPQLYYDNILKSWEEKLFYDNEALTNNQNLLETLNAQIDIVSGEIDDLLAQKEEMISSFQKLMGPALREGYWQPEDYQNYGEQHTNAETFTNIFNGELNVTDTKDGFVIGWDNILFDEEQKLYYESGINQEKIIYPCINISSIYNDIRTLYASHPENLFVMFNNNYVNEPDNETEAFENIKNIRMYGIGSTAVFSFIKANNTIYPALILIGAKNLTDKELDHMRHEKAYISIGSLTTTQEGKNVIVAVGNRISIANDSFWTFGNDNCWSVNDGTYFLNNLFTLNCEVVFPRIKFSSLMLKTSADTLFIHYQNELLSNYNDYYILNRTIEQRDYQPEYLITLKPEVMLRHAIITGTVNIAYTLSNASTAIYLDALEIAKENAFPKVSYTITPNVLNEDIVSTLYKRLNWLVMINDVQLKFNNVFGYISKLTLDLDAPWNDEIEIKNYKNKFEDLFSSIVASIEELKRNNEVLGALSRGSYALTPEGFTQTLQTNETSMINFLTDIFLNSDQVSEFLSNIFFEVSSILSDTNHAIGETVSLTSENVSILSSFAQQVQDQMVPRVYKQAIRPIDFKQGDIWIQTEYNSETHQDEEVGRYIATSSSNNAIPGYGWTRTYGGSMAQITGSGIDIDAENGTVDLFGKYVNIYGNHSVNIGGIDVNIGSTSDLSSTYGGINLVATGYNSQNFDGAIAAKVLIHPDKITMFSNEIDMLSGINNDGTEVSAVKISGADGIWLGSSAGVRLFSGSADLNNPGGANIELMPTHVLIGVSQGSNASAMKMTSDAFVVAAGAQVTDQISDGTLNLNGIGTTRGVLGFKISKDFMGMAVLGTANGTPILNAIVMNKNGITLGAGVSSTVNASLSLGDADLSSADTGSYVRVSGAGIIMKAGNGIQLTSGASISINGGSGISLTSGNTSVTIAGTGITLSSAATLSVNTNNVVIDSTATGNNTLFRLGSAASPALLYTPSGGLVVNGALTATTLTVGSGDNSLTYANGTLTVKGDITANTLTTNSGTIGGWTITSSGLTKGSGTALALLGGDQYYLVAGNSFFVTYEGDVWLKSLYVGGEYVDFTTSFKNATSITYSWSGSGNSLTVRTAVTSWGKLTTSGQDTKTITITNCEMLNHSGSGIGTGAIGGTVGGASFALTGVTISAQKAYNAGWQGCYNSITYSAPTSTQLGYGESVNVSANIKPTPTSSSTTIFARTYVAPDDNSSTVTHSPYLDTERNGDVLKVRAACGGQYGAWHYYTLAD